MPTSEVRLDASEAAIVPDPLATLTRIDLIALWERRFTRVTPGGDLGRFITEYERGGMLSDVARDLEWEEARVRTVWDALLTVARTELREGGPLS